LFVSALSPAKVFVLCIIQFSQHRGIAKLVKAPDSDSGIRGFESFFPCHLAELYVAGESPSWLRHRILIPAFEGSNPSSPAKIHMPMGAYEWPVLSKVRFFFSELFYPTLQFPSCFIEGLSVSIKAL
jgi:hypothetical protein